MSDVQPRRVWASPEDVAEWLQLGKEGPRKLRKMRAAGVGPRWIKVGRDVRYAWSDVHTWCRERTGRG